MKNIYPIYLSRLMYLQSKVSSDVLEKLKNEGKFILENQNTLN